MAQSVQIKKINSWHERLADWLILNPAAKQSEAAKAFGVTAAWLSTVINSDAFRDYWAKRSEEHSEALLSTVREKAVGVLDQALSGLAAKLEHPETVEPRLLLDTIETVRKVAQPEVKGGSALPASAVTVNVVTKGALEEARRAMRERAGGPSSDVVIDLTPNSAGVDGAGS